MKAQSKLILGILGIAIIAAFYLVASASATPPGKLYGTATDDARNIWQCGTVNTSGVYTMNQSISTTGDCLVIQADNIIINMNNFNMTGDKGYADYGIDNTADKNNLTAYNGYIYNFGRLIHSDGGSNCNYTNVTMQVNNVAIAAPYGVYSTGENISLINCNISMGDDGMYYPAYFSGSNNIVRGNTLNPELNAHKSWGLYFASSSNNTIENNFITYNLYSIILFGGSNNTISNNVANYNGYGVFVSGGLSNYIINNTGNHNDYGIYNQGNNSILINNRANNNDDGIRFVNSYNNTLTGTIANYNVYNGIILMTSSNNNLTDNIAMAGTGTGIYVSTDSDNNTFASCAGSGDYGIVFDWGSDNNKVIDSQFTGAGYDVYYDAISDTNSVNNTLLNTTLIWSRESVSADSQLFRQWHYQAYVNDSCGDSVSTATLNSYNSTNDLQATLITNATGWTGRTGITEYVNNGGVRSWYSNYTINVTHPNYIDIPDDDHYNVSVVTNKMDNYFTFTEQNVSANPIINSTCNWAFTTNQDVTRNLSIIGSGNIILNAIWSFTELEQYIRIYGGGISIIGGGFG